MEDVLRDLIVKKFLGGNASFPLAPDTELLQQGICDSLGLLELALDIEARYPGVRIDDQDITPTTFGSIRRIGAYLRSRGVA
ncbi:MAG: acyl carrier protein [Gemmatimonadota bacterium]|nr:acyl carrier protein [Gemmatimonadota bacterium]